MLLLNYLIHLQKKNINVDVILQSIGRAGTKDISFTVNENDLDDAMAVLEANQHVWDMRSSMRREISPSFLS